MSTYAFLLICAQACLIQDVYSQCLGGIAPGIGLGYGSALAAPAWDSLALGNTWAPAAGLGRGSAVSGCGLGATCGGAGVGDVAVAGELPVGGSIAVAGQVPIIGAVQFGGAVPAAGGVSITGNCGFGCTGPYVY